MAFILIGMIPLQANAIIVTARFLEDNPQIFPVGELVSVEQIEDGEDIDLGTLPDLFAIQIGAMNDAERDSSFYMMVILNVNGTTMVQFTSTEFLLSEWMDNSIGGGGTYTNTALWDLQNTDIIDENGAESYYADVEEFLTLLDGSNLSAGLYTVQVSVYNLDGVVMGSYLETAQVYNPSAPSLQGPDDGDELSGYPIFFSWNWHGGLILPSDVTLIIVEGEDGDDPEGVIDSRSSSTTRFEGNPQLSTSHTYTGSSGDEQAFQVGQTYYWRVDIEVSTVIPGSPRFFSSNVHRFTYNETGSGGGSGGGGGGDEGGDSGDEPDQYDPVIDQLSSVLPPEIIEGLIAELTGFTIQQISIDGVNGYSSQELIQFLMRPTVTTVTVGVE